jgi:hypothetical protein
LGRLVSSVGFEPAVGLPSPLRLRRSPHCPVELVADNAASPTLIPPLVWSSCALNIRLMFEFTNLQQELDFLPVLNGSVIAHVGVLLLGQTNDYAQAELIG